MDNANCVSFTIALDSDEYNVDIYPKPEYEKILTLDGETLALHQWASRLGITPRRLLRRLRDYIPEVALDNTEYRKVAGVISKEFTHGGKTLDEWAIELGISYDQLRHRLRRYAVDVALDNERFKAVIEANRARRYKCNGKSQTTKEWATELGISVSQLRNRLNSYSHEIALDNEKFQKAVQENRTRRYTFGDESLTTAEWAQKLGLSMTQMSRRLRRLPIEEAINVKYVVPRYEYDGKSLTCREWATELNVSKMTFQGYVASHSLAEAVERYRLGKAERKHKRRNVRTRHKTRKASHAPDYPYIIINPMRKSQHFVKLPAKYARFDMLSAFKNYFLTGDGKPIADMIVSVLTFYCNQVRRKPCTDEDIEDLAWTAACTILMKNNIDKFESNQHILNYLSIVGRHKMSHLIMLYERREAEKEYACCRNVSKPENIFGISLDEVVEWYNKSHKSQNDKLSARAIKVLQLRAQGLSLQEIAVKYKVTRERIRQIESKAVKRLTCFAEVEKAQAEHIKTDQIQANQVSPDAEQKTNQSSNVKKYTYLGRTMSLHKWAKTFDISPDTLAVYSSKIPIEVLLERLHNLTPTHLFTYNGESLTIEEWAKRRQCSVKAMQRRLIRQPVEKALAVECYKQRKLKAYDTKLFTYNGESLTLREWASRFTAVVKLRCRGVGRTRYEYNGQTLLMAEWARKLGANYAKFHKAIMVGHQVTKFIYNNEKLTAAEWGHKLNLDVETVLHRIQMLPPDIALGVS
jgi:DNA-binding CsgD family transcriptional regulator/DNA-binding Lrp family transcriptional regulator